MSVFWGTAVADRIVGGAGADQIYGQAGDDTLYGAAGNDWLNGGLGSDIMVGGLGDDIYYVAAAGDGVVERAGEGTDWVLAWISYQLAANVEHLTLSGTADLAGTGNALNNTILGNAGNNVLNGGAGADTLIGGNGNDVYDVDSAGDRVQEAANEGYDRVRASVSFTLGANLEELNLTGAAAINGTGNALANTIVGNAGANVLTGGAGDDVLIGGAGGDQLVGGVGNDVYDVNAAGDQVVEAAGQGADLVRSSISYGLGADVENLTLTGLANLNGTGNVGNNFIIGNAGNNKLSGGAGDDRLSGGDGNDELRGGGGTDYLAGGSGNDNFFIGQVDLKEGEIYDGGDGYDVFVVDDGVRGTINLSSVTLRNFERIVGGSGVVQLNVSQFVSIKEIYTDYIKILDGGDIGIVSPDVSVNTITLSDSGNSLVLGVVNSGLGRSIVGGLGDDHVVCSDFSEQISGGGGNDRIVGGADVDWLFGDAGRDDIVGGGGDDIIGGGKGDDHLSGGSGADLFKFLSMADGVDMIEDFNSSQGDRLYFGFFPEFDMLPTYWFEYRGSAAFTGEGTAEARFSAGQVFVDLDGNGVADIAVKLNGITEASQLHERDFAFWWEM